MAKIEKFLSENERIIEESANNYLTNNRLMKLSGSGNNFNYKEIQLDKIDSFQYSKDFNTGLAILGLILSLSSFPIFTVDEAFSLLLIMAGLALIFTAYLTATTDYVARSSSGAKIKLNSNANSMKFWKSVNEQKNK